MVYGQEKLFPDEKRLRMFLDELEWAWNLEEMTAKQIAEALHFGEPEAYGFPNLKPQHVYYFVQKYGKEYGMEPRRKLKKKEEDQQTEVKNGVPYTTDMPFAVANYLREKGLLVE